jgi:hypothetical protein
MYSHMLIAEHSGMYLHSLDPSQYNQTERMRIQTNTKHTICTGAHNHLIRILYYTDQKYGKWQTLLNNMGNAHKLSVKIFLYRTESVTLEISYQRSFKYFHIIVLGFNVKHNSTVLDFKLSPCFDCSFFSFG